MANTKRKVKADGILQENRKWTIKKSIFFLWLLYQDFILREAQWTETVKGQKRRSEKLEVNVYALKLHTRSETCPIQSKHTSISRPLSTVFSQQIVYIFAYPCDENPCSTKSVAVMDVLIIFKTLRLVE